MEETYTYDAQMVQFLYRELSAGDAVEMAHMIEEDSEISADFSQLPKHNFQKYSSILHRLFCTTSCNTAQKQLWKRTSNQISLPFPQSPRPFFGAGAFLLFFEVLWL